MSRLEGIFAVVLVSVFFGLAQFGHGDLDIRVDAPKPALDRPVIPGSVFESPAPQKVPSGEAVRDSEILLVVDDFDASPVLNALGGMSGVWEKDPMDDEEMCTQAIVYDPGGATRNKVLRLTYDVDSPRPAYNGFWTRLNGLDLTSLREVRFKIKGDKEAGFPRVIKVEIKNPVSTGHFYVRGISDRWQEIRIPIEAFRGLRDPGRADELVVVFEDRMAGQKQGIIYLDDIAIAGSRRAYEKQDSLTRKAVYAQLLGILEKPDDEFLHEVEQRIFAYFPDMSDPATGLVRDRSTPGSPASIAATGFGLAAFCIAESRGWMSRVEAYQRVMKILRTLEDHAAHERGYFYHFLDAGTAKRWGNSEVSSIDTALLMAGVITAGRYFRHTEAEHVARRLYERVQWDWMAANEQGLLFMEWTPENQFEKSAVWNMAAEEMILYILAMGSTHHAVPADAWMQWERNTHIEGGRAFVTDPGGSLFTHLYSHAFIDFRNQEDAFADYWENSRNAVLANRDFCMRHAGIFKGYGSLGWGLSASDGPSGYRAYGAKEHFHDGTLAPYAIVASVALADEIVIPTLRHMLMNYGERLWGRYGPTSAYNPSAGWYSKEHIGIDQGIMLLMIENYRTGFMWRYVMDDPSVQRGMKKAGFRKGEN